jgi:DNA-binding transcriptional regulator YiaG
LVLTLPVPFDTRVIVTSREILALRKALGMTQHELADLIGAQRHTVSRWELGENEPRGANLKALKALKERVRKRGRRP